MLNPSKPVQQARSIAAPLTAGSLLDSNNIPRAESVNLNKAALLSFPQLRKQGGDNIGVYVNDVVADLLVLNRLVHESAGYRSGRWQIAARGGRNNRENGVLHRTRQCG